MRGNGRITEYGMPLLDDYRTTVAEFRTPNVEGIDMPLVEALDREHRLTEQVNRLLSEPLPVIGAKPRLAAVLDEHAPAKAIKVAEPDALVLAVPDFRENGLAVWIGDQAAVRVVEPVRADLDRILEHVGPVVARTGHFPVEHGIVVAPHSGVLAHPACGGKYAEAQAAWRIAQDTLIVR